MSKRHLVNAGARSDRVVIALIAALGSAAFAFVPPFRALSRISGAMASDSDRVRLEESGVQDVGVVQADDTTWKVQRVPGSDGQSYSRLLNEQTGSSVTGSPCVLRPDEAIRLCTGTSEAPGHPIAILGSVSPKVRAIEVVGDSEQARKVVVHLVGSKVLILVPGATRADDLIVPSSLVALGADGQRLGQAELEPQVAPIRALLSGGG